MARPTRPAETCAIARPPLGLPAGRAVELPGRGTTWVHEAPGPPGAPTLVLLHGWLATGALNWFPAFGPLADRFRVVTLDHRGHGRGIRTGRRFRLSDCADDVAALADVLDIERFVAVGYSMGGPIAQLTWHRHRERVAGLVLCATAASFRASRADAAFFGAMTGLSVMARATPARMRSGFGQRLLERRFEDDELGRWGASEVRRHDHRMLAEAAAALGRFSSTSWLGEVDAPTSVLLTTADRVVPPARQVQLARALPDAEVRLVEGDHVVCPLRPDRFVPHLVEACQRVTAPR